MRQILAASRRSAQRARRRQDGAPRAQLKARFDAASTATLEGIERRPGADREFDVVAVDNPDVPAQPGRLVWDWC
jgi:hypothetical protein